MSNTNIHILTKNEYKMTRCQDGIILLFSDRRSAYTSALY